MQIFMYKAGTNLLITFFVYHATGKSHGNWMLLFGNNMNKFTYNNCITEIIYNLVTTRGYYYGNLCLPWNKRSGVFLV